MDFTTYRHKFSDEFLNELYKFSKIHQHVDRKTFKEEWSNWCIENEEYISREKDKLVKNGYKGNCQEKMYVSARYYLRKKKSLQPEPKIRRPYTNFSKEMIESMDIHIKYCYINQLFKPSICYELFLSSQKDLILNELKRFDDLNQLEFYNKVKKTYKNRFFIQKNCLKK